MLKSARLLLVAFTLALLVPATSPAAPAPLPRHKRTTTQPVGESKLDKAIRKLEQLRVVWRKEDRNGQAVVRFSITRPDRKGGMGGTYSVSSDDLVETLQRIINRAELFLAMPR